MIIPRRKLLTGAAASLLVPDRTLARVLRGSTVPPPTIPALAAAAGKNTTTFYESFNTINNIDIANSKVAGFNFYTSTFPFPSVPGLPFPTPQSDYSIGSSNLNISTNSAANANNGGGGYQFSTRAYLGSGAPRSVGIPTFSAGAYFGCRMKFNSGVGSTTGFPAIWWQDLNGTLALADNNTSAPRFGEVDFIEWQFSSGYSLTNNVRNWNPPAGFSATSSPKVNSSGITADSNWHLYELDWDTVAQGGGTGSLTWYYDGVAVTGSNFTYTSGSPEYICDSGNFMMFIDNGVNMSMTVDYIQICQ